MAAASLPRRHSLAENVVDCLTVCALLCQENTARLFVSGLQKSYGHVVHIRTGGAGDYQTAYRLQSVIGVVIL